MEHLVVFPNFGKPNALASNKEWEQQLMPRVVLKPEPVPSLSPSSSSSLPPPPWPSSSSSSLPLSSEGVPSDVNLGIDKAAPIFNAKPGIGDFSRANKQIQGNKMSIAKIPDTPIHKPNKLAGFLKTSKYVKQHGFSKNQIDKRFKHQEPKRFPGVIEISDCRIPRVVIEKNSQNDHPNENEPRDQF
jgi:hypothetical protein